MFFFLANSLNIQPVYADLVDDISNSMKKSEAERDARNKNENLRKIADSTYVMDTIDFDNWGEYFNPPSKHTNIQREKLEKEIKGKLFTFAVKIYEVSSSSKGYRITGDAGRTVGFDGATINFIAQVIPQDKEDENYIENLKTGDVALMLGFLDDVSSFRSLEFEPAVIFDPSKDSVERAVGKLAKIKNPNSSKAQNLGSQSWDLLLDRKFAEAIKVGQSGYDLDNSKGWILTNIAHGYLLNGNFDLARKIYVNNKNLMIDNSHAKMDRFGSIVISDFKVLKSKGIVHPDMDKIEELVK
jgi:hypothetical protein